MSNLRKSLAQLLDNLYGLHFRPGHLDAVMEVIHLHAPVKIPLGQADPVAPWPTDLREQLLALPRLTAIRIGEYSPEQQATVKLSDVLALFDSRASVPVGPLWQPIASAPKDGRSILVHFQHIGTFQVFWSEYPYGPGIGAWCVTDNKNEDRPLRGYASGDDTCWTALPNPPVSA